MENFIPIVLLEFAVVALTVLGCLWAARRHRQPGWHIAFLAAVAPALLLLMSDSLLFQPSQWSENKRSLESYVTGFSVVAGIGIIPALLVVRHYRSKYRDDAKSVA